MGKSFIKPETEMFNPSFAKEIQVKLGRTDKQLTKSDDDRQMRKLVLGDYFIPNIKVCLLGTRDLTNSC